MLTSFRHRFSDFSTILAKHQSSRLNMNDPVDTKKESSAYGMFSAMPSHDKISTLTNFLNPQQFNPITKITCVEDEKKYIQLLVENVLNRDDQAVYLLAVCFFHGYGLNRNEQIAISLLRKAAHTYPQAGNDLGMLYLNGYAGLEVDKVVGKKLIKIAADSDCADAIMNLGMLYETGNMDKVNLSKAMELYERAKVQGHKNAQEAIDRVGFKWTLTNMVIIQMLEVRALE